MEMILLPFDQYSKLVKLAEECGLSEKIDFKCHFLVAVHNSEIMGAAGFRITPTHPRFEHIFVRKEFQGKARSLALRLMRKIEEYLSEKGFKVYSALIPNWNTKMIKLATKFGFKKYVEAEGANWYYKTLKEKP